MFRIWIKTCVMIALIIIGSQSIAVAKSVQRDVAGHLVLCTGHGPTVVLVDADGIPIDPAPVCPECIVHFAPENGQSSEIPDHGATLVPVTVLEICAFVGVMPKLDPISRGPPVWFV